MARSLKERFEGFVDRQADHDVWTGATRPGAGTGRMRVDGKEVPAHRIAWELANGKVPPGSRVMPCRDVPRACESTTSKSPTNSSWMFCRWPVEGARVAGP